MLLLQMADGDMAGIEVLKGTSIVQFYTLHKAWKKRLSQLSKK